MLGPDFSLNNNNVNSRVLLSASGIVPGVLSVFSLWPQLWEVSIPYPHFAGEETEARKFKELAQDHSFHGLGLRVSLDQLV